MSKAAFVVGPCASSSDMFAADFQREPTRVLTSATATSSRRRHGRQRSWRSDGGRRRRNDGSGSTARRRRAGYGGDRDNRRQWPGDVGGDAGHDGLLTFVYRSQQTRVNLPRTSGRVSCHVHNSVSYSGPNCETNEVGAGTTLTQIPSDVCVDQYFARRRV